MLAISSVAWAGLTELIATFDNSDQPYRALVRAEFAFAGDYDHLSRLDEWATRHPTDWPSPRVAGGMLRPDAEDEVYQE